MLARLLAVIACTAAVLLATSAVAAPGPLGWRGDGTGHYPSKSAPAAWSATENVAWKTPMPAWGNASPIVVGDQVFVTAEPTTLVCLDRASGKILWTREHPAVDALTGAEQERVLALLAKADGLTEQLYARRAELSRVKRSARKPAARKDPAATKARLAALTAEVNDLKARVDETDAWRTPATDDLIGYASSTPTSDGRRVYVLFGNGVAAAWKLDGTRAWIRHLGPGPSRMNGHVGGHTASPILAGQRLILPYGRLRAVDPRTGKDHWVSDEWQDFGGPAAIRVGGEHVIVSSGTLAHRLSDGAQVSKRLPLHLYTTPIAGPSTGTLLLAGATLSDPGDPRSDLVLARLGSTKRDVQPEILWGLPVDAKHRQHASPLLHDGLVYVISARGMLTVVDAANGTEVYRQQTPLKNAMASPAAVGDHIHLHDDRGRTHVIRAGRSYKPLGTNTLEPFRATPFAIDGQLYFRSHDHVWRVGTR